MVVDTEDEASEDRNDKIPIVTLTTNKDEPIIASSAQDSSERMIRGLETIGFVLVSAPDVLSASLCRAALDQCANLLEETPKGAQVLGVKKQGALALAEK